jgi:general secretion pathway protein K
MMFEEGQFEVQILDHSGRIQINQLVNENGEYNTRQKELLTRFLRSEEFDLDEEQVNTIVSSIKDWIDPDNEATDFGAEAFYYQALERPHSCRNGPLESLADLLLIRGITKELFYGTTERPGISNYLTVQGGDGRININTASPLVLRALSDRMDEDRAENMVKYRQDEKDLKDPKWYTKVPEMNDIFLDPDLITTKSTYFEILSKASIGPMAKQVRTMVERKEGEVKILSWQVE